MLNSILSDLWEVTNNLLLIEVTDQYYLHDEIDELKIDGHIVNIVYYYMYLCCLMNSF